MQVITPGLSDLENGRRRLLDGTYRKDRLLLASFTLGKTGVGTRIELKFPHIEM